jgi:acyl-coenzyme A synthetase/AMP-(fatty) acid ligase
VTNGCNPFRPSDNNTAEIMDEDPLFILYTSGSTGKPRNGGAYYSRIYGVHSLYF